MIGVKDPLNGFIPAASVCLRLSACLSACPCPFTQAVADFHHTSLMYLFEARLLYDHTGGCSLRPELSAD